MESMSLLQEVQNDYKNADKIKAKKKKVENLKKIQEERTKQKRIATAVLVFVVALIVGVYWFAKHYYVQIPFTVAGRPLVVKIDKKVLQGVVAITTDQEVVEAEPLTDMEVIEQYDLALILKVVYMLESTWGQNDYCKEKGTFNGYGYRQNSYENKCYESFEQVTERVNEWLEERLAYNGNDLAEALCYYNTGIANNGACEYSQKFMRELADNL